MKGNQYMSKYDIEGLSVKIGAEIEEMAVLFSLYLEEMKSELSLMERFCVESDWVMLQRTVHNVKGVSANLDISDMFEAAEQLDSSLKRNETGMAAPMIGKIKDLFMNAEEDIKRFFLQRGCSL